MRRIETVEFGLKFVFLKARVWGGRFWGQGFGPTRKTKEPPAQVVCFMRLQSCNVRLRVKYLLISLKPQTVENVLQVAFEPQ